MFSNLKVGKNIRLSHCLTEYNNVNVQYVLKMIVINLRSSICDLFKCNKHFKDGKIRFGRLRNV